MALSLKHKFTSPKADSGDTTLVRPSNWNDEHDLTAATGKVLGTTTSGTTVTELPIAVDTSGRAALGGALWGSSSIPALTVTSSGAYGSGQYNCITLTDNLTNNVDKGGVVTGARYANTNKPFTALAAYDSNSNRIVELGGGGYGVPDATLVRFFTAPAYNETDNAGVERMRITSDGNVGIGATPDSGKKLHIQPVSGAGSHFEISGYDTGSGGANANTIARINNYNNDGYGDNFVATYSRGTKASPSAIQSGDYISGVTFAGNDGTAPRVRAEIATICEGAVSSNNVPTRIGFFAGSSSLTERFRIASDGQLSAVVPGNTTLYPGFMARAWVSFNGTGTPAISGSGNVTSITDIDVGTFEVNFTTAMPDTNFATCCSARYTGGDVIVMPFASATTKTELYSVLRSSGAGVDSAETTAVVFR
jgi:hypothetical protein